jgi:hypothetical protein
MAMHSPQEGDPVTIKMAMHSPHAGDQKTHFKTYLVEQRA